jgi:hypothetical protein
MAADTPPEPTELDRSEESSTTALYRAAIGPIGSSYYLPIFARFEAADRGGMSWNWAASLTTLNWLAFRKLWSAALAYAGAAVGIALLIFGIGRLVFRFSETVEMALLAAFAAVLVVVPGLFANALLHADSRKRMAKALSVNTTLPEACAMLERQASSRQRLIVLAVANAALLGVLAAAYLYFPVVSNFSIETVNSLATVDVPAAAASATALAASSAASAPQPIPAAPAVPTSAPTLVASPPAMAASAPAVAASSPMAIAPVAPASAGRAVSGRVQTDAPRKAPEPPARAASQPASSPQEVGKVYRSEPAPVAVKPAAPASTVKPVPAPAGKPSIAVAAAKPKAASSAPKATGSFLINVGLFAQESNATNAVAKLKEAGLNGYSEEIRGPKGKFARVRVGPFSNQTDADAAAVKIKSLGLDALVMAP